MIMVANKRTKKQMRDDLQLFLGENTDTFVNWLHQVLEKLQEVTLPPASKCTTCPLSTPNHSSRVLPFTVTQKVSGKGSGTASASSDLKKEKKSKKTKRSQKDQSPSKASGESGGRQQQQQTPSITDVFADQLIGKAKRSLEIETQAPVKKQEARKEVPATDPQMPSITDMVKHAVVISKRKELEELEQIQKQIDEAKRQLKIIPGEPIEVPKEKTPEQEEDDDFLNLKADELEDEDNESQTKDSDGREPQKTATKSSSHNRHDRSPIVFDRTRQSRHSSSETETRPAKATAKERVGVASGKGDNIISLSAHRQMERELYTPVHRRREENASTALPSANSAPTRRPRYSSPDRDSRLRHRQPDLRDRRSGPGFADRERNPVQHRQRSPHRRERREPSPRLEPRRPFRERERERDRAATPPLPSSRTTRIEVTRSCVVERESPPPVVVVERLPVRQRIGSRVIVAPPKLVEDEEEVDVPVSSVVTIKPRPVVAKNRQANKNLLLRAMAEAQKSMVGTLKQMEKPLSETTTLRLAKKGEGGIKGRLGGIANIASKRQRSQINAIVSSLDPVLKRQKPNEKIIIEIGPNDGFSESDLDDDAEDEVVGALDANGLAEVEYVPKPIETVIAAKRSKEASLAPKLEENGEEEEEGESNTQFVVTLDGAYKKSAAGAGAAGVRKRVEVPKRREVTMEANKAAPAVESKGPEVGIRSRKSSRNAGAAAVKELGAGDTPLVAAKKKPELREDRAPRKLVDLRQRVEEKRNGSPAKRRSDGAGSQSAVTTSPGRKRRSPIKFTDNGGGSQERERKRDDGLTTSDAAGEDAPPLRKRIRISLSPERNDSKVTNGEESSKPKSSVVVVVSKEKEKRDPKKYDNIPSCKLIVILYL